MSDRHQYSYWLTATSSTENTALLKKFKSAMELDDLLKENGFNGYLTCSINSACHTLSAEVMPELGTVEEDTDLLPAIEKLAKDFPELCIELDELDEEDKSQACSTVFQNGRMLSQRRMRTVPLHKDFDDPTVQAISRRLEENGHADIAADIIQTFLNH